MSHQTVHVRVNDAATPGAPGTPVRIRFTDSEGQYLAPFGRLTDFPTGWNEDVGGSVMLGEDRYAYIDGSCEINLPHGIVHIDVSKGPEYVPIHHTWDRKQGQISLRLNIERKFNLQHEGWYAGDSRVHFLSPQAAWLEGSAEGLQVVNVLAAEWRRDGHRLITNLLEFSGQEPALIKDDCIVVVNTFNQHETLGNLSLLNCHRVVYPLAVSGDEAQHWTLADWCNQCHRKGGLVVWPNNSEDRGEQLVNLVPDKIDAVEWTELPSLESPALQEWYGLLNRGLRVPIVGGSGKTSNGVNVGRVRTYARLKDGQPFNYANWIEAIRNGRTFVTGGPVLTFTVNGLEPGSQVPVAGEGKPVVIQAEARSVDPFDRLEVVCNGNVIKQAPALSDLTASVSLTQTVQKPCWLAARAWRADRLLAHTSPAYVGNA